MVDGTIEYERASQNSRLRPPAIVFQGAAVLATDADGQVEFAVNKGEGLFLEDEAWLSSYSLYLNSEPFLPDSSSQPAPNHLSLIGVQEEMGIRRDIFLSPSSMHDDISLQNLSDCRRQWTVGIKIGSTLSYPVFAFPAIIKVTGSEKTLILRVNPPIPFPSWNGNEMTFLLDLNPGEAFHFCLDWQWYFSHVSPPSLLECPTTGTVLMDTASIQGEWLSSCSQVYSANSQWEKIYKKALVFLGAQRLLPLTNTPRAALSVSLGSNRISSASLVAARHALAANPFLALGTLDFCSATFNDSLPKELCVPFLELVSATYRWCGDDIQLKIYRPLLFSALENETSMDSTISLLLQAWDDALLIPMASQESAQPTASGLAFSTQRLAQIASQKTFAGTLPSEIIETARQLLGIDPDVPNGTLYINPPVSADLYPLEWNNLYIGGSRFDFLFNKHRGEIVIEAATNSTLEVKRGVRT